ncbi:hypothetical protein PN497_16685 [Sphaerospermopsis kisseleviana CS-549]|jgi:hypothetical protein|uniref:Uncharacterized protein n=1 Tax=Sphaerospermopsis kisseleviana CS-549 TaxID=3021783 RepID=A0ABT4ZU86_9CYAN|nr:hypothetical protein [Sphaerospermopsis kisseleviana]MDB9442985.1 hypothetical protein [Sphaerospermopsis kisseleviana CS-549]BAZ81259.1 hypothetical protein NIES73_25260 [Sphaerospermopsis kisseleviana NIES-73]
MSNQTISSDLVIDLSIDEQQLINGGEKGTLDATGDFVYGDQLYPATIKIRVRGLP